MAERGTIIEGKYEVLKLIGKGGMSKVYLAMDKNLNKRWGEPQRDYQGENVRVYYSGKNYEFYHVDLNSIGL